MSNGKWSTKGSAHQNISLEGMRILNQIYLRQTNSLLYDNQIDIIDFEYDLVPNFNNYLRERHEAFEAFQFALSAEHGLGTDESRYYYDPFYKDFIPIYYDGEVRIMRDPEVPIGAISTNSKKGIIYSLKIIDNLNKNEFQKELLRNGVNLSNNEINVLIKKIRERILSLEILSPIGILEYNPNDYNNLFYNNFDPNIKLVFNNRTTSNALPFHHEYQKINLLVCNYDLSICTNTVFNIDEVRLLLEQKYTDEKENDHIFVGISLEEYIDGFKKTTLAPLNFVNGGI